MGLLDGIWKAFTMGIFYRQDLAARRNERRVLAKASSSSAHKCSDAAAPLRRVA